MAKNRAWCLFLKYLCLQCFGNCWLGPAESRNLTFFKINMFSYADFVEVFEVHPLSINNIFSKILVALYPQKVIRSFQKPFHFIKFVLKSYNVYSHDLFLNFQIAAQAVYDEPV